MISDYNTLQLYENENQIAIDFDGVIHKNSKGYHDGTVYDEPIEGSIESIKELYSRGYKLVIFTAKAKNDRPLINGKTGRELIIEWLERYNIRTYIHDITSEKPRALIYIDDKGLRFSDWKTTLNFINNL